MDRLAFEVAPDVFNKTLTNLGNDSSLMNISEAKVETYWLPLPGAFLGFESGCCCCEFAHAHAAWP